MAIITTANNYRILGSLVAAAAVVLALQHLITTVEGNNVYLTNDMVTLNYHPTLSSNVITTLYPNTQVSIRCKVGDPVNAVNGDPWWLYVDVPSSGNTGWVSDWYVECGGNCPGSICSSVNDALPDIETSLRKAGDKCVGDICGCGT